jgi:hypothetical protein
VDKIKEHFSKSASLASNFAGLQFLSCDATVLKTVARVNPTLYLMNGPVVKQKWSWTAFKEVE